MTGSEETPVDGGEVQPYESKLTNPDYVNPGAYCKQEVVDTEDRGTAKQTSCWTSGE